MAEGPLTRNVYTRSVGMLQIRIGDSLSNITQDGPVLTQDNSLGAMANTKFTGTKEFFEFMSGFPSIVDGSVPMSEIAQLECAFKEIKPFTMALANGQNPLTDIDASVAYVGESTTAGTTDAGLSIAANNNGSVTDTWMVVFDTATTGTISGISSGQVHTFADLVSAMEPDNGGNPYFSIPASFFTGTWAAGETYTFRTTAFVSGSASYSDDYNGELPLGRGQASDYFRVEAVLAFPWPTHKMYYILPRAQSVASLDIDHPEGGEPSVPVILKANQATSLVVGGDAVWDDAPLGKVHFIAL